MYRKKGSQMFVNSSWCINFVKKLLQICYVSSHSVVVFFLLFLGLVLMITLCQER